MNRLLLVRLAADTDLVESVERVAREHGITSARIHSGPGSLNHATLETTAGIRHAPGPAAEILVMVGEIHHGQATLHGVVGDPEGRVHAGQFIRGRNPVCITVELTLEHPEPE